MRSEEHETHVCYDYHGGVVRFYTTRKGEASKLRKRLAPVSDEVKVRTHKNDGRVVAWDLVIPIDYFSDYAAYLCYTARKLREDKAED